MGRWFFTCLVLCAGTVGLVGWLSGAWSSNPVFPVDGSPSVGPTPSPSPGGTIQTTVHPPKPAGAGRFVTIPDGRLLVVDKQEVSADAEGILQFVGTEVKPGEKVAPDRLIEYYLPFLAVECDANSPDAVQVSPGVQDKRVGWKRWEPGTPLPPGKAQVLFEKRAYRKLEIGDKVQRGDTVALVNPELIGHELAVGVYSLSISEAERSAAKSYLDEYAARYQKYVRMVADSPRSIAQEEIDSIRLGREKSLHDLTAKTTGVAKTEREILATAAKLRMHQVQARMGGTVKMIYKHGGDAVRKLDPVVQLLNTERVRVESLVGIEQVPFLRRGMKVAVEASRPDSPVLVVPAHNLEVTCLAVSSTATPVVVSGSEDRTVRGWEGTAGGGELWKVGPFPSPVRSLACSPATARQPLALIGLADGSAWLFDMSQPNQPPLELLERHKGSVNAVCFTPDGKFCVTAGDDRAIAVWDAATRKKVQVCTGAHSAAITSLAFTPENLLVSTGRDHALNVWAVNGDQPLKRTQSFDRRSGEVAVTNTDGRRVLYEQGKELRVLSLKDQAYEGVLHATSGASTFSKFALFAPDGKTILTAGTENKLQLWRTPTGEGRGAELRQFLWSGGCTCGVFAPDGAFAVTGTTDGKLLVWAMPGKDEIEKRLSATLTLVEQTLDSSSMQVRVWAELDEVPTWLVPGSSATIVVPVEKPKALSAGR